METKSVLKGGDNETLIVGDYCAGKVGTCSTLIGGLNSELNGGDNSTLIGKHGSKLTAGWGSMLSIQWWDGNRSRMSTAYVGENGIYPQTPYKLDDDGNFVTAIWD